MTVGQLLAQDDVYDVHTDHLDTPRMLTDSTQAVVWRACGSSISVRRVSSTRKYGERRPLRRFAPVIPMVQTTNARQSHNSRVR